MTTPCFRNCRNCPVRVQQSAISSRRPSKCAGFLSVVMGSLSMLTNRKVSEACSLCEVSTVDMLALARCVAEGLVGGSEPIAVSPPR